MGKHSGRKKFLGYLGYEERALEPLIEEMELFPQEIFGESYTKAIPTLDESDADPERATTNERYVALRRRLGNI